MEIMFISRFLTTNEAILISKNGRLKQSNAFHKHVMFCTGVRVIHTFISFNFFESSIGSKEDTDGRLLIEHLDS